MSELEQYLTEKKLINKKQLDEALAIEDETGLTLIDIIHSEGWLKKSQFSNLLNEVSGREVKIVSTLPMISDELFSSLPKEFCKERNIVPIGYQDNRLIVALSNPLDNSLIEEVGFMAEDEIELAYMPASQIHNLISSHDSIEHLKAESGSSGEGRIVTLVQSFILGALQRRASDIHIEPAYDAVHIRYRIDGVLVEAKQHRVLKEEQPALISRIKIISGLDISEKRLPQDGRILFKFNSPKGAREVDIRVSIIPSSQGEAVVLRILDRDAVLVNIDSLGFSKVEMQMVKKAISRSNGLILSSGPTGSGKTTSLYAILSSLNKPENKILTIEDPVEYQIAGIEQVQAHADIGLTFAEGLRAFLRHDPDIIMVGEIRDEETAEIAVRSSLTGHLVLSTIHTNDAASSVTRLLDMGLKPYLVASTLTLVMAQRLIRLLCVHCKKNYSLQSDQIKEYGLTGLLPVRSKLYKPIGCAKCDNTGYHGRAALFELMFISPKIKEAILNEASSIEIRKIAQKEKMKTLLQSGLARVKKGVTTIEEVFRVAQDL